MLTNLKRNRGKIFFCTQLDGLLSESEEAEDFHTLPQNETELRIVGRYSFSDLKIDITEESVDS